MNTENYFESFVDDYADEIVAIQPQFYKNAGKLLNDGLSKLKGGSKVLDIGNGGVINYDFSNLGELICADLSVSGKAVKKYEKCKNVKFCKGNMLNLEQFEDNTFDAVIVQTVIHHLAGKSFNETEGNVTQGINECMRVLKKGGQLMIVESTVVPWFECVERMFYPLMQLFFRIIHFDTVYQYSSASLHKKLQRMGLNIKEYCNIEIDKYIWLCRKKVLSKITPCGACWILIEKQ